MASILDQCVAGMGTACAKIIVARDSVTFGPHGWTIIIFIILTILYWIITYYGVRPQDEKKKEEEEAKWAEAVGGYFGIIGNLTLLIYAILIAYYATNSYYHLNTSATFLNPIAFAIVCFVCSSFALGGYLIAQSFRKTPINGMWTGLASAAIVVLSALVYGLARLGLPKASAAQISAVSATETELTASRDLAIQQQKDRQIEQSAKAAEATKAAQDAKAAQEKLSKVGASAADVAKAYLTDSNTQAAIQQASRSRKQQPPATPAATDSSGLDVNDLSLLVDALRKSRSRDATKK